MGIGTTIGLLVIAFATSALLSYMLTERRRFGKAKPPEPGTTLRMRASSGMYRSKLVAVDGKGWRVSAPLSRNHYVPLRVDEALTIEAPVADGVYLFRTVVKARDTETHELTLEPPTNVSPTNRRTVKRCPRNDDIRIDGRAAHLVDISSLGAKVKTEIHLVPGDRVRLDLPEGLMYAWVLDSTPTRHGDAWPETARVRFEASHETACV